jgi:hypothetical protein
MSHPQVVSDPTAVLKYYKDQRFLLAFEMVSTIEVRTRDTNVTRSETPHP